MGLSCKLQGLGAVLFPGVLWRHLGNGHKDQPDRGWVPRGGWVRFLTLDHTHWEKGT